MINPNKKINLNEGRHITDGNVTYGGFPRILEEGKKLAKKDYDKDGKLETSEQEHRGAVDRAIKAKKGMMKENIDEVDIDVIENLLEELFDEDDMDIIIEAAEKKKWIQKAIKKEGSLRKTLKAKKGEKIPEKKLEAAAKKGGKTGKRARLALTLKKLNENATKMFNDADDKNPNDEQIATHPDESSLENLQSKLSSLEKTMEHLKDLAEPGEYDPSRGTRGEAIRGQIADIQDKIMKHPKNPKPASGSSFFAKRTPDPNALHDRWQRR